MAQRKRKFGGKTYTNVASTTTKREANLRAKNWRKQGSLARVIKVKGGYEIYVR